MHNVADVEVQKNIMDANKRFERPAVTFVHP